MATYEYTVVESIQDANEFGKAGWRVIHFETYTYTNFGARIGYRIVMEKAS